MKLGKKEVTHTYSTLEIDGKELYVSTLLNTLEDLQEADGLAVRLVIYEKDIAELLEEKGAAVRNVRGSYGRGKNLDSFTKEVWDFLREAGYFTEDDD